MRRFTRVLAVLAVALAAGCGGGGSKTASGDATTATTVATTVPAPSTTTAGPATALTLRVTDLHLANSEESDNAVRILLPAGVASASVTLMGLPSPNQVVSVCQANDLNQRMSAPVCRTPANGEATTIALGSAASGVEIVQVGTSGTGPTANNLTVDEALIRYSASTRDVRVRLPQIASGDSGGRPTFGLTPPGTSGTYQAELTWTVIQVFGGTASDGQLELVQGTTVADHADNAALDVRLNGTLPQPVAATTVRLQNLGAGALVNPKLTLLLP